MKSHLAAGAAALVLGAGLSVVALPASAAPAAATHTVTYSPGVLPVLGALGITVVPGVSPTITAPDGGAIHTGDTIVFKTTDAKAVTVQNTVGSWRFSLPVSSSKSASVTVPATAGTYGYGVGNAKQTFQASPANSGGATPPPSSGGGPLSGLPGGQGKAPGAGSTGGSGQAGGSGGAASSGSGGSGALSFSDAGGSGSSGAFDSSRFGTGSGDFPNLPGGVLAPEAPLAGSSDGGLPPEIATYPTAGAADGAFGGPAPSASPNRSSDTLANASQDVGSASGSSVTGPAAVAAVLLALVAVGLSRAWIDQRPLHRH